MFNKDPCVIELGAIYLRMLAVNTLLTTLTYAYGFASRSIENAFLSMLSSSFALLLNTFLNYILIFGHFGLPTMGVICGGGDVLYSLFAEGFTMLVYWWPLAFIGALWLHLLVYLVFALIAVEEVAKFGFGIYRMLSNKWIHNLVN